MSTAHHELKPVAAAGATQVCDLLGSRFAVVLDGTQTGNAFAIVECVLPAGAALPPHFHLHEDVLLILKSGRLEVTARDQTSELTAEGVFFAPRGCVHAARNTGNDVCRFWVLTAPAGLESLCARFAGGADLGCPHDGSTVAEACRHYGLHLVPSQHAVEARTTKT